MEPIISVVGALEYFLIVFDSLPFSTKTFVVTALCFSMGAGFIRFLLQL